MKDQPFMKRSPDVQEVEQSICGFRRRLIKKEDGSPLSITRLRTEDAQAHWHRNTHEYYYILEGSGSLMIDDEEVKVEAGDCVWITPGHVHRAVGSFEALILGTPPFDYDDVIMTPPKV